MEGWIICTILQISNISVLCSRGMIRETRRQRDFQKTTFMLIVVIGFFLVTEIPLMIITMLHTLSSRYQEILFKKNIVLVCAYCSFGLHLIDYDIAKNIVIVINVLICFSFPFNFAIYCGMSR